MITGYIYMIYKEGLKEMYIGSTIDLEDRKNNHKSSCNNPNVKDYNFKVYQFIRDNGGWDEWVFEMIEQYDCENEVELHIREQYYLDINKEYLLNCVRSYRSEEERKEYHKKWGKEYYENNKEQMIEQQKEYRKKNIEKIKEREKQYRENNKEKKKEYYEKSREQILEQRKEYYKKNRQKILERQNEYNKRNKEKN